MAAAAFAHLCSHEGVKHIEIDSAGLNAREDLPVSDLARAVLSDRSIPLLRLRSQVLTGKLVNRADLVVTMTHEQRDAICARYRQARLKTVPLMAYADSRSTQVPDPFGGSRATYDGCLDMMLPALDGLLDELR